MSSFEKRTAAEKDIIMEHTKENAFFMKTIQELGNHAHKQLASYLTYEWYPEGSFIFEQGDAGSKFYIIIEGEVSVHIKDLTL